MKKNKRIVLQVFRIIGYLFSAVLFIFYFVILLSAKEPDVCYEYEQYYITKDLEDWPGYGGLAYQLDTPVYFDSNASEEMKVKRRGKGWGTLEEDGCWTYGDESTLFFTELPAGNLKLELYLTAMEENTYTEVYANSEKAGVIDALKSTEDPFLFSIPESAIENGRLILHFKTIRPEEAKITTPALGIKVKEIILHEDK